MSASTRRIGEHYLMPASSFGSTGEAFPSLPPVKVVDPHLYMGESEITITFFRLDNIKKN